MVKLAKNHEVNMRLSEYVRIKSNLFMLERQLSFFLSLVMVKFKITVQIIHLVSTQFFIFL